MNNFVKILDEKNMFYYINDSTSSNALESIIIILTIVFTIWTIKLAIEKK